MSKLEQGGQRPTEEDLRQWVEAVGATAQQLDELYELASAARVEYATFDKRYQRHGGAVAEQETTTHEDASSTRIAEFQPAMIPGLLQTAAYAREVLTRPCGPASSGVSSKEIEAIVGKRMERQQILYDPQQTIHLIMGEAALHTRFGNVETLVGQLDRLTALTGYTPWRTASSKPTSFKRYRVILSTLNVFACRLVTMPHCSAVYVPSPPSAAVSSIRQILHDEAAITT